VLYALKNIDIVLIEFRRILKPSGKLIICDPRKGSCFLTIFWSHLASGGGIKALIRLGTIIGSIVLVPELLWLGLLNFINDWRSRRSHKFRTKGEWLNILGRANIVTTYANQHWLIEWESPPDLIVEDWIPENVDYEEWSKYFIEFFKGEPWNEFLMCPRCKREDDFGPAFTWGEKDEITFCPSCKGSLVYFWSPSRLRDYFTRRPDYRGRIALCGKDVVAWAWGFPLSSTDFYIDTVAILPQFRKKIGIHRFLKIFQEFIRDLNKQGYKRFEVRTHKKARNIRLLLIHLGFQEGEISDEDPERSYWQLQMP